VVKLITDLSSFADLKTAWNTLPGARANPLLSHEWFLSCAQTLTTESQLHTLALYRDGRLSAVAPLRRVIKRGAPRLELLGAADLFEPCGVLHDDADALGAIADAIAEQPYSTALQRIDGAGTLHEHMQRHEKGHAIRRRSSPAPYLDIRLSWDDYFKSLSSRRRYDFRNARKRLEAEGPVTVEISSPPRDQLDRLLTIAFGVEAASWKGRNGSALLYKTRLQAFFRLYAARACELGTLRLGFLKVGGNAIAMQLAVQHANRFWVLKIGYDENWKQYSPGMQLMMDTIRYAHETGCEGYEFLGSHEPWIEIWTKTTRVYDTLMHYPKSFFGFAALGIDGGTFIARKLATRLKTALVPGQRAAELESK
jgi:CelD/BcsL family acetyltransferase involved in cellulose biosynthesis